MNVWFCHHFYASKLDRNIMGACDKQTYRSWCCCCVAVVVFASKKTWCNDSHIDYGSVSKQHAFVRPPKYAYRLIWAWAKRNTSRFAVLKHCRTLCAPFLTRIESARNVCSNNFCLFLCLCASNRFHFHWLQMKEAHVQCTIRALTTHFENQIHNTRRAEKATCDVCNGETVSEKLQSAQNDTHYNELRGIG